MPAWPGSPRINTRPPTPEISDLCRDKETYLELTKISTETLTSGMQWIKVSRVAIWWDLLATLRWLTEPAAVSAVTAAVSRQSLHFFRSLKLRFAILGATRLWRFKSPGCLNIADLQHGSIACSAAGLRAALWLWITSSKSDNNPHINFWKSAVSENLMASEDNNDCIR